MTLPSIDNFPLTYGGPFVDLAPVEDTSTDRPAAGANQALADTAAMTQTAIRAFVRLAKSASGYSIFAPDPSSSTSSTTQYARVWCDQSGMMPYASWPTIVRVSAGIYVIAWLATVVDSLGVTQTLNFRGCLAPSMEGSPGTGSYGHARATVTGPSQVTLRMYDGITLAPSDLGAPTILVAVF